MTSVFISSSPSLSYPSPHTFSKSMIEENMENAQRIITRWGSETHAISIFHHNPTEAMEFVQTVNNLRHVMHFLISQNSGNVNSELVPAQKLMLIAMKTLEKEFHHILSTDGDSLDSDAIIKLEQASSTVMSHLKLIADCMIACGYCRECVKTYEVIRRSVVEKGLYRLGIEKLTSFHLRKMNEEARDRVVTTWLVAIQTAVRTLFKAERLLCEHVFAASDSTIDCCFLEITKQGAMNLFKLPQRIAKGKMSPERIFRLMDLHEALSDVWPDIDSMFSSEAIKSQCLASLLKLAQSIRTILLGFEAKIQKDSSRTLVAGGGIHPLTHSVMNYISLLADYEGVLSGIVADHPPSGSKQLLESGENSNTAVSAHLARLILVLLCKLDSKTHLYKDLSLGYLFLANNLQFVVDRVHTSKLRYVLGDDWVFSHANKVVQYAANYQLMAWAKVLASLTLPPSKNMLPEECFRKFNAAFEESCRKQTSWIIPDGKLRDEIKLSTARMIVPPYQQFYDSYFPMLNALVNFKELVRFSPDELGNYLSDLFHGTSVTGSTSSSSHSPRC